VLEREGRRIIGEYMLTKEDVLSARKFTDGVVKNSWPIELWTDRKGRATSTFREEITTRSRSGVSWSGITNLLTQGAAYP